MKQIIEYYIVSDYDVAKFTEGINHMIKLGWQPYGNVALNPPISGSGSSLFVQPMVKFTDGLKENSY